MTPDLFATQMAESFGRDATRYMGVPDENDYKPSNLMWHGKLAYEHARLAAHFGRIALAEGVESKKRELFATLHACNWHEAMEAVWLLREKLQLLEAAMNPQDVNDAYAPLREWARG